MTIKYNSTVNITEMPFHSKNNSRSALKHTESPIWCFVHTGSIDNRKTYIIKQDILNSTVHRYEMLIISEN